MCSLVGTARNDSSFTFSSLDSADRIIGFTITGGWGGFDRPNGRINMRYGYFIKDKLLVGPDINYGFNGSYYRGGEAGPYIRYYFRNKRLAPFVEGSYHYRWTRINAFASVFTYVHHEFTSNVGLALLAILNHTYGIEGMFQYGVIIDEYGNSNLLKGFVFRITYHF